jgi:dihydrofolate synthase/folylpolyglutamate synthase
LTAAGYKTGLFTSPYVKVFNERIAINNKMISDADLARITTKIKPIADQMVEKPTEFELITAIAFEYFSENDCDFVVLECGLGGRLDSTNLIDSPVLSVITGIAIDHASILGDTIEQIATEKAGIIKKGIPCLWCGENEQAKFKIENRAKEMASEMYEVDHSCIDVKRATLDGTVFDFKSRKNIFIPLLGEYQPINASNVLEAIDILISTGISISEQAIYEGLSKVVWHARFELMSKTPIVIVDGGHNPEGVDAAVKSIQMYFQEKKVNVVTGVMADKDYCYIADRIKQIASKVYCVSPNNPRALSAEKYSEVFASMDVFSIPCNTIEQAIAMAVDDAKNEGKALLCVGSLYSYSEICKALEKTF